MIRGGTMWYQTDGCKNQYKCSMAYYLIYFLSKSYQIVLDRAVDTRGHGRDIEDGFNDVWKQYVANCLRICSPHEIENIESDRMRVDDMTEKGEVILVKE